MPKQPKPIPFRFVLDELDSLNPRTNPMFGCYGVYVGDKIVLALRSKDSHTNDNGVWIATRAEHHASLKKIFPSMRSIHVLGGGSETNWQIIPELADDFEESAMKVCELIRKGDPRIGSIPKKKKSSKNPG
ncbi:MAG TPA: hypothetical protein VFM90_07590 [Cyclobacteriaceae bacterium]|nr:hypothetical protein [Cyclobacteriaceae bacterium]